MNKSFLTVRETIAGSVFDGRRGAKEIRSVGGGVVGDGRGRKWREMGMRD